VALATIALTGCYIVPINPDGTPAYPYPYPYHAVAPAPGPAVAAGPIVAGPPAAAMLAARLYPSNELATQTGMISGTVTNMMNGKGRFQMDYRGELLSGEATRVNGDDRRGVASAYGPRGTYMSCEYRMTSPYQGAGTCTMSNGAQYSVHLGG
jgi:hypothetical protein